MRSLIITIVIWMKVGGCLRSEFESDRSEGSTLRSAQLHPPTTQAPSSLPRPEHFGLGDLRSSRPAVRCSRPYLDVHTADNSGLVSFTLLLWRTVVSDLWEWGHRTDWRDARKSWIVVNCLCRSFEAVSGGLSIIIGWRRVLPAIPLWSNTSFNASVTDALSQTWREWRKSRVVNWCNQNSKIKKISHHSNGTLW